MLLLAVLAWVGAVAGVARADGFIVINQPVAVPPGHFPFAPLEVKFHHVNVKIDGQICTTQVEEEFYNPNPQQLEGTYLFPVPKTAQIDKFSMLINGKDTAAELLDADKARGIYEEIVRRMRDPALLEYADRGLFRVHVYPIEGHSSKLVKISYTEVLKADAGLVSYVYPLNTEKFSSALIHDVSVKVDVSSMSPLTSIYSPTHDVEITRPDPTHAVVGYEAENVRPDTDFQLFFAPQKKDVSLDLLTYRTGDDDGYFLLLASPGVNAKTGHLPKDVTFVLDTSGSMADDHKLEQAKKALTFCLANLNDDDRFEVIRFSTEPEPLFGKLTTASKEAVDQAQAFVSKLKPAGGTAIFDALHQAIALRPGKSDRPYVMVFLTDGMPTVGTTDPDQIVAETNDAAESGTRIFCFGMGTDVNAHLLDRIAENTHAVSVYVLPTEDIEVKVSNFFAKIREPVLADVKLAFPDGIRVTKMYPKTMPDLFKGDQLVLCGRYSGEGKGDLVIEGNADGQRQHFAVPVEFPKESETQPFVPRLWASRRVAYLLDEIRLHGENPELKSEATDLARQFGLVTPYTAYLIMQDEQSRGVTAQNQVMGTMSKDASAVASAGAAFDSFEKQVDGQTGVAVARSQNALKYADVVDKSLAQGNAEAASAMAVPADAVTATLAPSSTSPRVAAMPAPDANTRVLQYTQQVKYVSGRAFYQNGNQWVDGKVSAQNTDKDVRLKFGSDEYFAFITKHPETRPWLALGQNVRLVIENTVYDIYDEGTGNTDKS